MKKTAICLLISLGIASLLLFLENKTFYQTLHLKLYDLQMNMRKAPVQDRRILFVEMDDATIDHLGRWPWPRNIFATILDTLHSLGAKQVLFDVTFTEPNQVFFNKEAVNHIFQGKEEIDNYIEHETGLLKGKETLVPEDAVWLLNQIRNGFLAYTDSTENRLKDALIDNDQILADSFANSNSYIGYSFEVLSEPKDIQKNRYYQKIKKDMTDWNRKHFDLSFQALPATLKRSPSFSENELKELFLRSKVHILVEERCPKRPQSRLYQRP